MTMAYEEELSRIKQLKEGGLLTDEEFHQLKMKFLAGERGNSADRASTEPALWNPKVANFMGLFFHPAVSTFLHAKNWKELGEPVKARNGWIWFWGSILALLPSIPLFSQLYFVVWYLCSGSYQSTVVKLKLNNVYTKKSLVIPWIIAIALFAFAMLAGYLELQESGQFTSPPAYSK